MDRSFQKHGAKFAEKSAAVMVNGDTLFTVTGPVQIEAIVSECITANDGTASTVKYTADPTVGAAADLTAASASLASAAAGSVLVAVLDAAATAPTLATTGVMVGGSGGSATVMAGVIKIVVAVGSTTGTWKHYVRYRPLARGAQVY